MKKNTVLLSFVCLFCLFFVVKAQDAPVPDAPEEPGGKAVVEGDKKEGGEVADVFPEAAEKPEGAEKPEAAEKPEGAEKPEAAEVPEGAEKPEADGEATAPVKSYAKVRVGIYTVQNSGNWAPAARKMNRRPLVWKFYMHGVIDHFAQIFPWDGLFGKTQTAGKYLDEKNVLKTMAKVSPLPTVRLGQKESLLFENSLPLRFDEHEGKTLRLFVWMQGVGVGVGKPLTEGMPGFKVIQRDGKGVPLASWTSHTYTRGTFPWHCYYLDIPVDSRLASLPIGKSDGGLFLELENPVNGSVWFSTLSAEILDETAEYSKAEMQDPTTGSLAPNCEMDELPIHLTSGRASRYVWNFLRGPEGGARNVPELTTIAGLNAYCNGDGIKDYAYFRFGTLLLTPWIEAGQLLRLLPQFEKDWLANYVRRVLDGQNTDTGLWRNPQGYPSCAATVSRLEFLWRSDGKPYLEAFGAVPPCHKAILRTLMSQKTSLRRGGRSVSAWDLMAYEYRSKEDAEATCFSLAATRNALVGMRILEPHLSGSDARRLDRVRQEAMLAVFADCVLADGLWRTDGEAKVSNIYPGYLPRTIQESKWLVPRSQFNVPVPEVKVEVDKESGEFTFTWNTPSEKLLSARIFSVPVGSFNSAVSLSQPVAIMERADGEDVHLLDPINAVGTIRDAAMARWGVDIATIADAPVVGETCKTRDALLATSHSGKPLICKIPEAHARDLFVAGVDAAGELSNIAKLEFVRPPKPAAKAEDKEDVALAGDEEEKVEEAVPAEEKEKKAAEEKDDEETPW